jgi:CO/xanthine dehydrogenase Mo-binding subunit
MPKLPPERLTALAWRRGSAIPEKNKDHRVGDAEGALKSAEVVIDQSYSTPTQHHIRLNCS